MCSQNSSYEMARHYIQKQPMGKDTNQDPIYIDIKRRKWEWIGHTLRKFQKTSKDCYWNPQKKRIVGRPRQTWRRSVETEAKEAGLNRG